MKKSKRILSMLLSLLMAAGICVLPAGAEYVGPAIVQVAAGDASFAVTEDGTLWGWGSEVPSYFGMNEEPKGRPQLITSGVKSIAVSREGCERESKKHHALVLLKNGVLQGVGYDVGFSMGQGSNTQKHFTFHEPAFIMSNVSQASVGSCLNAAVTNSGDLYIWGHYDRAYNPDTNRLISYWSPTKIASGVKQVDVGHQQVVYLTTGGDVYAFGVNNDMRNGVSSKVANLQPKLIMSGCKDVAVGEDHYFAVKEDGTLWFWGYNGVINIVKESQTRESIVDTPIQVASNVRDVDASAHNAFYIDNNGVLWGGGNSQSGLFGIEDGMEYPPGVTPTFSRPKYYLDGENVTYGFGKVDSNVKQVSSGGEIFFLGYVLYLKNDGKMWGAGLNNVGQLGNGKHRDLGQVNPMPMGVYGSGCNPFPILAGLSDPGFDYHARPSSGFYDVPDAQYYTSAVKWAVSKGITNGTSENYFSPELNCTQAQIVTFIYRTAGWPSVSGSSSYTDSRITPDKYYYNALIWAANQGIVTDMNLDPEAECSRSDVVTYLWRHAGKPAISGASFTDVSDSAPYYHAVSWAVANGIVKGTSSTTYSPDSTCTRGQIVTFLQRTYDK